MNSDDDVRQKTGSTHGMTEAIGYTRLSQDSDVSIEKQKQEIRDYCGVAGIQLVEILDDGEFSSGFDVDRDAYQLVKERVQSDAVGAVVVRDKTRIGRDFDERMRFVLDLREHDVELHSALRGEQVDLSDPTDAAVESIHAAKDDESKREEIEKARQAVEDRMDAGLDHGRPRFGMEYDDAGEYQVPGEEFDTVLEILKRAGDETGTAIAEDLDMPRATVYRVIDREEWYRDRTEVGAQ